MKVAFRHTLTIEYSRVLENLSLLDAILHPSNHLETIDLKPFGATLKKHSRLLNLFKDNSHFELSTLELALCCSERQDIHQFWQSIENVTDEALLVLWLGSFIDLKEAEEGLKSLDNFKRCLENAGKKNVNSELVEVLFNFRPFILSLKALSLDLDSDPSFDAAINKAKEEGLYHNYLSQWQEGMKDRHPLSYGQELMGKPFWNIADYEHYEFVPVYFVSPYRLRLMDDQRMIYIQGLHRKPGSQLQTSEDMAEVMKLLSDSNRLKILKMLYMKPMYGKEIAEATGLTTATVSHHLEVLKQKGFINLEQVKQIKYFSANMNAVRNLFQQVDQFIRSPLIEL